MDLPLLIGGGSSVGKTTAANNGCWLRNEATARRLPWVPSQPWETLVERILHAVNHLPSG